MGRQVLAVGQVERLSLFGKLSVRKPLSGSPDSWLDDLGPLKRPGATHINNGQERRGEEKRGEQRRGREGESGRKKGEWGIRERMEKERRKECRGEWSGGKVKM